MTDAKEVTALNRIAWDEIAEVRHERSEPAEFFADGGCRLGDRIIDVAGNVRGLGLCHLQCSTGEDTLSWANRGAYATGVDISPKQIELARRKAASAGLPVRFIDADVYDLPAGLFDERFDIVFTGGGSIVWLPDLDRCAQIIVRLLKPNGRLILDDEHPLAGCIEVQDGQVKIVDDYFGRRPLASSGWSHFSGAEEAKEIKYEFVWPLGDVVTALARAGLRIELLEERPSGARWRFGTTLKDVAGIPGDYLLVARKDRGTEPAGAGDALQHA